MRERLADAAPHLGRRAAAAAAVALVLAAAGCGGSRHTVGLSIVPRTVPAESCSTNAKPDPSKLCAADTDRVDIEDDRAGAARPTFSPLEHLLQSVPRAGQPSGAASNARYDLRDSDGLQMDVLSIAPLLGPVTGPSCRWRYVGVYHLTLPEPAEGTGSDFALRAAVSCDLRSWTYRTTLVTHGASQGDIRELPDGGFLVAYEQQSRDRSGSVRHNNIGLLHYQSLDALLSATADAALTIPRLLAPGVPPHPNSEGTPNFRSVDWEGSLAASTIHLGFHYLTNRRTSAGRMFLTDRQAHGTLDHGRWIHVAIEQSLDAAFDRAGFIGSHGGRDDFTFQSQRWRVYEARTETVDDANTSWRLFLYKPARRRSAAILTLLAPRTRDGSTSLTNPKATLVPAPGGSGRSLVVTTLALGRGQLLYYFPEP